MSPQDIKQTKELLEQMSKEQLVSLLLWREQQIEDINAMLEAVGVGFVAHRYGLDQGSPNITGRSEMKTKPFDLTAAVNGAKLVTRHGREAKFIAHIPENADSDKVVAAADDIVLVLYENGRRFKGTDSPYDIFLAVTTRSINGHEYPEPERVAPSVGTPYWYSNPYTDDIQAWGDTWSDQEFQHRFLRKGLVHLTREAAEAHARAIILAGGGEV